MDTIIYYFSATGNSMQIARSIAGNLRNSEIVSIAKLIKNETIEIKAQKVGFVFPVYAWGLPRIVEDFIRKTNIPPGSYVFAVATCVAIPGNTLVELDKLLKVKGIKLDAGFAVKAGRSSLMRLNALDKIMTRLDNIRLTLKSGEERLNEIAETVRNKKHHKSETSSWASNTFGGFFHKMGINSFKTKDAEFEINENCKGCGNCVKVCPRANIFIENNKPVFRHNCELCHACIQWCNNFAIRHIDFDAIRFSTIIHQLN